MMEFDVNTKQLEKAFQRFEETITQELQDAELGRGDLVLMLMEQVGELDVKQAADNFASEGAKGGEKWPALQPGYKERKEVTHPGRKILARDGRLRESLTSRGHSEHILDVRAGMLRVGTRVPYALVHDAPQENGRPDLPRRSPIQKSADQLRRIKETIAKVILQRVDQLTGGAIVRNRNLRAVVAGLGRPRRNGRRI